MKWFVEISKYFDTYGVSKYSQKILWYYVQAVLPSPTVFLLNNVPTYFLFSSSPLLLPGPDGQEVLLVTIPEFSSTQTACLVNLRTLECEPVSFSAFSADEDEESEMNISHWGSTSTHDCSPHIHIQTNFCWSQTHHINIGLIITLLVTLLSMSWRSRNCC